MQGFEPRQAESESAVLPLDDTPVKATSRLERLWVGQAAAHGFRGVIAAPVFLWQQLVAE